MARKATIIKHLEMMGYSVGGKGGIYSVSLETHDGRRLVRLYLEDELNYDNLIIEKIVGDMNSLVVKNC